MQWTIVNTRDLAELRSEIAVLKKQRLEADIASEIRFQGMKNLFVCERERLEQHISEWRNEVRTEVDRETQLSIRQFERLKLELLQELNSLRVQTAEEIATLRDRARYAMKAITQQAKQEQDALKSRLLGSLLSLAPVDDIKHACPHEWPYDWVLSAESKFESQQCYLCDLWRFRFSEFWTQHHPQDAEVVWYGHASAPSIPRLEGC